MNAILELVKKNKWWLIAFGCFIGFLALAEDVFHKEIMQGDIIGYALISHFLISDTFTPIAKFITNFGGAFLICIITLIVILLVRNKKITYLVSLNLILVTVLNQLFKNILQRPRPTGFRIIDETGYSFPSGHSMVSMAFYGYFIYLIYMYIDNKYLKWFLIAVLSVLIGFIGISRIYLGVHYTSDVMAGFLFSIMYLIVYIKSTNKYLIEEE